MRMGVYIDMEMPKSCRDCRFCNGQANTDYGVCAWCDVDGKARDAYTMQDCPLVHVPPHGRLVDADRLLSEHMKQKYYHLPNGDTAISLIDIEHAPTVLDAEEG
jgi:hypothetical protein